MSTNMEDERMALGLAKSILIPIPKMETPKTAQTTAQLL